MGHFVLYLSLFKVPVLVGVTLCSENLVCFSFLKFRRIKNSADKRRVCAQFLIEVLNNKNQAISLQAFTLPIEAFHSFWPP